MSQSLFEVNEETGEVTYSPVENEEINDVGDVIVPPDEIGTVVLAPEDVPEILEEVKEETSGVGLLDPGVLSSPLVYQEEFAAAILAATPASGALGSSTLDYFDRIVSGLPYDAIYVAYRSSADDSYDGVLYFGQHYEINDYSVEFGEDAIQIMVDRASTSGYNNVTYYYSFDASGTSIEFKQDGDVLYYTNAAPGYPVLGSFAPAPGYSFYIVPALIGALAVVLFSKLLFRR